MPDPEAIPLPKSKLWLDQTRIPAVDWLYARTAAEAIAILSQGDTETLSLNHDPNANDDTLAIAIIDWLTEQARGGNWQCVPDIFRLHSTHLEGREAMCAAIDRIEMLRAEARRLGQ